MGPDVYNQRQMDAGTLTVRHITHLVRSYQLTAGLSVDGKCGPDTLKSMPVGGFMGASNAGNRYKRARSAIGHNTIYKLGKGGFHPEKLHPGKYCDCSGFVSWVIGLSRKHQFGKHNWISTSDIHDDATGHQHLFKKLPAPEPGCIVVYPDRDGRQGHCGIVTEKRGLELWGVDCASSSSRNAGDAIAERSLDFFRRRQDMIFCVPEEKV